MQITKQLLGNLNLSYLDSVLAFAHYAFEVCTGN